MTTKNRLLCKTIMSAAGLAFLFAGIAVLPSADCAILYKSYVVKYDRGRDILCDPYIVQKGDWVYKIFRQKGEISSQDFQEFLGIFQRLNPHIRDLDRIRPKQKILIPIKVIEPNAFSEQTKGIVTIPFVTISKINELVTTHAIPYEVKKGDFISKLISKRFGAYGSKSYNQGMKLFEAANPDLKNINLIFIGQKILLPNPGIQNEPWYESLFDRFGNLKKTLDQSPAPSLPPPPKPSQPSKENFADPIGQAAAVLDAKLLRKGIYFFPQQGKDDFQLDLSRFPVIEMPDGTKILFVDKKQRTNIDFGFLSAYWKQLRIVEFEENTSIEDLMASMFSDATRKLNGQQLTLEDKGLKIIVKAEWIRTKPPKGKDAARYICISIIEDEAQRTSDAIRRYLDQNGIIIRDVLKSPSNKHQTAGNKSSLRPFVLSDVTTLAPTDLQTFVFDLLDAMGYTYYKNINVSFPYAGVQVKATAHLISTETGNDFLIDFGELYGDAVQEIRKTGLNTIQLKKSDSFNEIMEKILNALNVSYVKTPSFFAAKRDVKFNTEIKIPGYLVTQPTQTKYLISRIPLHNRILQFLNEKHIKVILAGLFGAQ